MKIEKYLSRGEVIRKTFTMKGNDVHATSKRLFISSFNGRTIGDYDYNHISSLVFNMKRYYWLIGVGIAILGISLFFINVARVNLNTPLLWLGFAAGIGCIVVGIILKKQYMKIFVVGVGHPISLYGVRPDLDDLFRIIRENKRSDIAVSTSQGLKDTDDD